MLQYIRNNNTSANDDTQEKSLETLVDRVSSHHVDVTVVLPVHNAAEFLDECLQSVVNQQHNLKIEVSAFLDACTDSSGAILKEWQDKLADENINLKVAQNHGSLPAGVGYAKNRAIQNSQGDFFCFMDSDDVMFPTRIQDQYNLACLNKDALIGSKFIREPPRSTLRYTRWANGLTGEQLMTQIYTSHGPTIIMPTWFCHRDVYERVGNFDESGKGTPEDLLFFYDHLRKGGRIMRVDKNLVLYRYHPTAATFSVDENTIWELRMKEIQDSVISWWSEFTIWNAGKQGRKFFRSLTPENQEKVTAFCDVDANKVGKVYTYEESPKIPKTRVSIVHYSEAKPPFIMCVKQDMTGGKFEENVASLNIVEGKDYHHFN